jgi:hypothetical protein
MGNVLLSPLKGGWGKKFITLLHILPNLRTGGGMPQFCPTYTTLYNPAKFSFH